MSSRNAAGRRRLRAQAQAATPTSPKSPTHSYPTPPASNKLNISNPLPSPSVLFSRPKITLNSPVSPTHPSPTSTDYSRPKVNFRPVSPPLSPPIRPARPDSPPTRPARPDSPYSYASSDQYPSSITSRIYPSPPLSEISGFTSIRELGASPTFTSISAPSRAEHLRPPPLKTVRSEQSTPGKFYPPGRSTTRPRNDSPIKLKFGLKKKGSAQSPGDSKPPSRFKALLRRERKKKDVNNSIPPVPTQLPVALSSLSASPQEARSTLMGPPQFVLKEGWLKKSDCKVHPYPEIPYPQSYDHRVLENDRYADMLLHRLRSGSPLFTDTGSKAPRTVLDLGCGPGHWILEAARAWQREGTSLIGFDLVDVTQGVWPIETERRNFKLVRGNFLERLPFADETFDFVRMANLNLCIPYHQWYAVLSEVMRVLSFGGRLELIDDEIMFSYGREDFPSPASPSPAPKINIPIPSSSFTMQAAASSSDSVNARESAYDGCSVVADSHTAPRPARAPTSLSSHSSGSKVSLPSSHDASIGSSSDGDSRVNASQDLETVFENMIVQRLGLHLSPSEFVLDAMKTVFGKRRAQLVTSMHLKLAPSELDRNGSSSHNSHLSRSSVAPPFVPQATLAAGMAAVSLRAAGARARSLRSCPGLILWPHTFIPIPFEELEMHACRNPRILLACKPALADYVEMNEDGARVVDEEFWDALWDYENFLKERYNKAELKDSREGSQPGHFRRASVTSEASHEMHQYQSMFQDSFRWEHGGEDSPIERSGTPTQTRPAFDTDISPKSSICSEVPPYTKEDQPHVRTIRVFEAIKTQS